MAIAFVQARQSIATTSPLALAYTSGVTAGNFLLAYVYWASGTTTTTVSDNLNGAWSALTAAQNTGFTTQLFYRQNSVAGAITVTATNTGGVGSNFSMGIFEDSGVLTSGSPIDVALVSNIKTSLPNTAPTATLGATPATSSLVFAGYGPSGNETFASVTVAAPFTLRVGNNRLGTADLIPDAGGTTTVTFTIPFSVTWNCDIVAFKAAPAAAAQNYVNTGANNFISQEIGFGVEF